MHARYLFVPLEVSSCVETWTLCFHQVSLNWIENGYHLSWSIATPLGEGDEMTWESPELTGPSSADMDNSPLLLSASSNGLSSLQSSNLTKKVANLECKGRLVRTSWLHSGCSLGYPAVTQPWINVDSTLGYDVRKMLILYLEMILEST